MHFTYTGRVSVDTRRSINNTTIMININPRPTSHRSREGMSRAILALIRVVKIMMALLLLGIQMIHSSSTTIDMDPGYLRGDRVGQYIISSILQGIWRVSSRSSYLD